MFLIAFDLATNTGIALGDTSATPTALSEILGEAGTHHGARFAQALRMTTNLILEHKPDAIVIEEPIAGGVKGDENRLKVLMGLRACIYAAGHLRKVKVFEYPVQTVRKHFIGRGNLTSALAKAETIARCGRLGWKVTDHNQADAMAVWDYARSRLTRMSTLPPNGLFENASQPNPAQPGTAQRRG